MTEMHTTAGMRIFIENSEIQQGEQWVSSIEPGLWIGAVASGEIQTRQDGSGEQNWHANLTTHFWAGDGLMSEHNVLNNGNLSCVFVHLPEDTVENILDPSDIHLLRKKHDQVSAGLCPEHLRLLAWQMLGCPYSEGSSRKLYMASRALELISHAVAISKQDVATPGRPEADLRLRSSRDIKRIHEARSILLANLKDPPTVPNLAKAVGLNARKLSQGFVELFGQPVYAYVKEKRLENARLMLENGATSVSQVAYHFGYNPAHFSTEFTRRYGHTPSAALNVRHRN